ncbi:DEAD-box ATP-dependent RNA helicase 20 isoform X2 [Solanum lycopersicum]|uniref:DEAD-box ATP-dependent RNA helicase 20 isoform X2 n=1 Tax=Solanum lycopersicum TaxID=4081 RepID=UPI000E1C9857|nr:DEAD-box ATP-dependent RNA helicase 20 isoform X2 [Solanum lycopersicum]
MSYVPPHLRNSAAGKTTTTPTINSIGADHFSSKHTSRISSLEKSSNGYSSSARRSSLNYSLPNTFAVPDPIFPHWKPSERVLRLKSEQIEEIRLRLNVDVNVSPVSCPAPSPIESFPDMCLHASIMKDIEKHGYTAPTSIQAQAMPVALSGRDLLGCAETGSGKTAAFSIPMIQHCLAQQPLQRGDGPLALVLAPTRELAQQIEKEVTAFSMSLDSFKTAIVVGGTNISEQRSELRAGVHIVVATPGRLIDHLQQGNTSLGRIAFVVLDEADRMLDMGFEPQIREDYLTNPVRIKVGKVSSPTANVSQTLEKVPENDKVPQQYNNLAMREETTSLPPRGRGKVCEHSTLQTLSMGLHWIDRLLDLLVEEAAQAEKSGHPFPLTIVFVERKTKCDEVAEALTQQGLLATALHGGRSQNEREAALRDFRHGPINILVSTDVASRGLDVTGVAHVINLDLPKTMEDYVHRIGRTGRAGSTGRATSFYTDRDMYLVAQIRRAIADIGSGNDVTIAMGKTARRKEREAAAAEKEARSELSKFSLVGSTVNVEDKYRHMIAPSMIKKEGAADDAWDD